MLKILWEKVRTLTAQFPHLLRTLRLVWRAAPSWTLAWVILLIIQGFLPVITVYLMREFVNTVTHILNTSGGSGQARDALRIIFYLIGVQLVSEIFRATVAWIKAGESELVQDYINTEIHKKSISVDLAFYDSPEFFDHMHLARAESAYRPVILLESISSMLQNSITLIAMTVVLLRFGIWIPFALLLTTVPVLFVAFRYVDIQHRWYKNNAASARRANYYSNLLTMREMAAEIRLFEMGKYFIASYEKLRTVLRKERLKLFKDQRQAEAASGLSGYLLTGGVVAWMAWKTIHRVISLGDLVLFYAAFTQGLRLMRSLLENLGQIYENSLFLGNLFEFLELKPQIISPPDPLPTPAPLREGITLNGLTFRYPGSQKFVLQNFNLQIPAGKITAVVGPNGAGKSTLIRLLCRFYDPDQGSIELDDTDLRMFEVEELRRMITVLFQEPGAYNATAFENIWFGDIENNPELPKIKAAAEGSGAGEIIARLPQGYDTLLGRWFEKGAELSVGEWQRVALARAFLRQAPILLLDEPTSAMDSWAETDWMQRLRSLVKNRTVVMITHRFTTAMQADIIHVVQSGQIVESGTHDELLTLGGMYARSWTAQTQSRIQTI